MPKAPQLTDTYVGTRVRMRRLMMAMTQEKLADALGITFQQVQKYEKGTDRVGSSRLQQLAHILQVPISFFFEGSPVGDHKPSGQQPAPSPAYVSDFLATKDGLALAKAFMELDAKLRRSIALLVEKIAEEP